MNILASPYVMSHDQPGTNSFDCCCRRFRSIHSLDNKILNGGKRRVSVGSDG